MSRKNIELEGLQTLNDGRQRTHYGGTDSSGQDSPNGQHCHVPGERDKGVDKKARRQLIIASILCLSFMVGEIVGGVLANSLAIATDAAHMLTDFASFMISLFALWVGSRPATKRMSFGWYRAEVMGALISVLMIWVVTGVLVYMAVERVISGDYEIGGLAMLITASCGVGVNIFLGIVLHQGGHGHSHGGLSHGHSHGGGGHGHSHEAKAEDKQVLTKHIEDSADDSASDSSSAKNKDIIIEDLDEHSKDEQNINVRAAFIHVIGDFVQSIGVLIASLIIYFKPEWKIADPICTFIFSVLVLITTISILRDTLHVLMEGTPRGLSFNAVKTALCDIPGVKELHNLRIWSLTMNKTAVAVHLALEKGADHQEVLATAGRLMRTKFGIHECTVQIETYVDEMDECVDCKDPQD